MGDTLILIGSPSSAVQVYSGYLQRSEKSSQVHLKRALARWLAGDSEQLYAEDIKRLLEVSSSDIPRVKRLVKVVFQSHFDTVSQIGKAEQTFVRLIDRFA